jgi:hypothetical protein
MQKTLFITFPLAAFFHAVSAWGQLPGQTPSSSAETRAVQVPLSGRTGQTGSVNTTQTPVPGITSSVNTLNTTLETQGPFAGSANSTARMPFSGTLSLREAVSRGVAFNLGAVGLAHAVRQAHGQ